MPATADPFAAVRELFTEVYRVAGEEPPDLSDDDIREALAAHGLEMPTEEAVRECECDPQAPLPLDVPDVRQSTAYSCGRACLAAVASFFGVEPTPDQLAALGTDPENGTSPEELANGIRAMGLNADAYEMGNFRMLRNETSLGNPVLTTLLRDDGDPDGHWVIVCGFGSGTVHLQDPAQGRVKMPLAEFERRWEHHGVALWKP